MTTENPTAPTPRRPNTLRTVLLVVGSIILIIILVGTIARFAFASNREDTSGTFSVEQQFDTVEIRASAVDVTVRYTDIDEAEIAFDQAGTELRLDYDVSGGVLKVRVERPGWGWSFGNWGWNDSAQLQLSLPESMERDSAQLTIETTAGNLTLDGEYGDVNIESTAGDLRMSGAAENLRISTTAGDVRLKDVSVSGAFISESTAGDSTLGFDSLPDSIEVRSTAGDVRATVPSGSYRVETDTTAGEVRQNVSSDQNSDRVYRFETTAGDVELNER